MNKELIKCPFCGNDKRSGGAWIEKDEPVYFHHRGLLLEYKKGKHPEMHGLCRLLYDKGFATVEEWRKAGRR